MRFAIIFVALVASVVAESSLSSSARQPSVVPITSFPYLAALLRNAGANVFNHQCSGIIINNRSILTSARCAANQSPSNWRARVGSAHANQGGVVHNLNLVRWADFDEWSMMNDIAIVRVTGSISFNNNVQPASISGPNYIVPDNDVVNTVGWGYVSFPSWTPTQYWQTHSVQTWSININVCRPFYQAQGFYIQNSMLCSGFVQTTNVNRAQDKCLGEPGAPLVHRGTVVGIRSFALGCNNAQAASVSTRVSSFAAWIQASA